MLVLDPIGLVTLLADKAAAARSHCQPNMSSHDQENACPETLAFWGTSAVGPVGLTLARAPDAHGPVTGAEQVLRLAEAEPLIAAVEQWLHGPWDPAPLTIGSNGFEVDARYRAMVRDPALAPPGTVLSVPLPALLAPPLPLLSAPALAWEAQPAVVMLGEVPADALARVRNGGLLWLPASFGVPWSVSLIDPVHELPPGVATLDLSTQRLTVVPRPSRPAADPDYLGASDALPVQLTKTVQVPLDSWLGWANVDVVGTFHWPMPPPWGAEICQAAELLARGALLPVGAGWGLRIEALAAAHPADSGVAAA